MTSRSRINARSHLSLLLLAGVPHLMAESPDEQLRMAIEARSVESARDAIQAGANVQHTQSALLLSALQGNNVDLCELLLDHQVQVNTGSLNGSSPLYYAVSSQDVPLALIKRLVEAGASLKEPGQNGGLVLGAIKAQRDDVANWLLDHGAQVNLADGEGNSELILVAKRYEVDESTADKMAIRLLQAGADPKTSNHAGKTAADFAAEHGYVQLLRLLDKTHPALADLKKLEQRRLDQALAQAIRIHRASRIKYLKPPAQQAGSQLAVIKRLLDDGANPNGISTEGNRAMSMLELLYQDRNSFAGGTADPEVLKLLLDHRATWESCGPRLPTTLFQVTSDPKSLSYALAHGLPFNSIVSSEGTKPTGLEEAISMDLLHAASMVGADDSVRQLLKAGADINGKDSKGYTPLMRAVACGNESTALLLMSQGASQKAGLEDPDLADLAAQAGLISLLRKWDTRGVYVELCNQYPPQDHSRWIGEWWIGTEDMSSKVVLRPDGMALIFGHYFAWRETEDGILIRMQSRRLYLSVSEVSYVSEGLECLKPMNSVRGDGIPAGEKLWRTHVPKREATELHDEENQAATNEEINSELASYECGRSQALTLSQAGQASLPNSLLLGKRWKRATLYWMRLRTLPKAFGTMTELEALCMGNQAQLDVEPGALVLPKLRALTINKSRLRELPLNPANLPLLEELNVSDNRLQELPAGWAAAARLKSIIVTGNRLKALPDDLGQAPLLQMLVVSDNLLDGLPDSLERAPIKTLSLAKNRFTSLPMVLSRCQGLEYLSVEQNQLREIPPWLLQLRSLKNLDLSQNPLGECPDLSAAKQLEVLSLNNCGLTQLPEEASWLPASLVELDLFGNQLTKLPAWIKQRPFRRLNLRGNPIPEAESRQAMDEAETLWRTRHK